MINDKITATRTYGDADHNLCFDEKTDEPGRARIYHLTHGDKINVRVVSYGLWGTIGVEPGKWVGKWTLDLKGKSDAADCITITNIYEAAQALVVLGKMDNVDALSILMCVKRSWQKAHAEGQAV